jgi:hypothetical protein
VVAISSSIGSGLGALLPNFRFLGMRSLWDSDSIVIIGVGRAITVSILGEGEREAIITGPPLLPRFVLLMTCPSTNSAFQCPEQSLRSGWVLSSSWHAASHSVGYVVQKYTLPMSLCWIWEDTFSRSLLTMGRALLVIDLTAELVIIVPLLCRIILWRATRASLAAVKLILGSFLQSSNVHNTAGGYWDGRPELSNSGVSAREAVVQLPSMESEKEVVLWRPESLCK